MSFVNEIEADLQSVETWAINFLQKAEAEAEIIEADVIKLFQFIQPYAQMLANGILPLIASVGGGVPVGIIAAAQGVAEASNLINQAVAAQQAAAAAGQSNLKQVVALGSAAYQSLKSSQASLAQAQAAAAKPTT